MEFVFFLAEKFLPYTKFETRNPKSVVFSRREPQTNSKLEFPNVQNIVVLSGI